MFWLGKSIEKSLQGKEIKFSPIEIIILSHLRSRELRNDGEPVGQYGYEMIRALNDLFSGSWEAKSGTIYPILSKLENKKKMLVSRREKSPLGPAKKVYLLTDLGRESIDLVIRENFKSDIEFILKYFNMLSPFVLLVKDEKEKEELLDLLMKLPAQGVEFALENIITELDRSLMKTKLNLLKQNLLSVLKQIDKELDEEKTS